MQPMMKLVDDRFIRFLISGAINTLLTYAVFVLLGRWLHHAVAYTIAYLLGIALSYAMAAMYVFRTGVSVRNALRFPLVYVVQYLYGLAVLSLLVDRFGVPQDLAMIAVIATSIPLTFLMTRHAMRPAAVASESSGQKAADDPTPRSRARP